MNGKTTEFLRDEYCKPVNAKFVVDKLPLNEVSSAGLPGVFDVIDENPDLSRQHPVLVNGFHCYGIQKHFLLMLRGDAPPDVYIPFN